MALGRDRLIRPPVDLAEIFLRGRVGGRLTPEARELLGGLPVQQPVTNRPEGVGATTTTAARGGGLRRGGGSFGTPRSTIRRARYTPARGRENTPATAISMGRGRGRATGSSLPSWYPRTPLRDITAISRAIERRRARLGEREGDGLIPETPITQAERVVDSDVSSSAPLEHNFCTPAAATTRRKPCPPSIRNVSKILLNVANQNAEELEFLTPQKKLLNSIDTVEKAVREELQRIKRTPSARKEERQIKVRTLMSMR
ncbi:hypothetical protein COLO4_28742 [Corchorus olitorius]|uniref:Protein POLYCHOME-like n=1 Tax=Corchorus olitorius TaxID=93759 RepID=A0A1R3HII0_9ROSI|nr:hypothetical protein COLO4_28742 [Corchorus olitorius]